jgi:hypothetical protein
MDPATSIETDKKHIADVFIAFFLKASWFPLGQERFFRVFLQLRQ